MGKYYVTSGEVQAVISAPHVKNAEDAACEAMLEYLQEGVNCAPLIVVSERGFSYFEHESAEDRVFHTNDILEKAGFIFEDENDC